jgi:hypothetical protein
VKSLVVFYSRTGTASLVASKIAGLLHADTDRIIAKTSYDGRLGYLRGIFQSARDHRVSIEPPKADPASYDLVVIGGPEWLGQIDCPVRTYLREHGADLKRVAFFVTQGGNSPGRCFTQMEALSGKQPVATLSLFERKVVHGNYDGAVRAFAEKIEAELLSGKPHAA